MTLLAYQQVSFEDDGKTIINNVSFEVEAGDFISIVGPSGGGKSTLLKLASFLISPTKGEILFKGKNLKDSNPISIRQAISYCFQTPHLFGSKVKDNIAFPYDIRHEKIDQARVTSLFDLFKMDHSYLNRDITKLSGGEKQRISLIRQLLFQPEILLLDEVTSALDQTNKEIVEDVIKTLHDKGVTILWITHDAEQSRKYANKLMTVVNGQIESLEVMK
ncbi:ABC transporter ATP-binding protein [Streptococcus hongkongensis]|nr:methionine ABC transporter ATP-binding protein [Streptococcus uberis]